MSSKEIIIKDNGNAVFGELNDKHLDHCLCMVCPMRKPGSADNCPINDEMDILMDRTGTKIPVWECNRLGILLSEGDDEKNHTQG